MATPLSDDEVVRRLASRPGWSRDGGAIVRVYDRPDFAGSIAFVNAVAAAANALNHHPDIAISWNKITIRSSSHDAGGITARDFTLAEKIDAL